MGYATAVDFVENMGLEDAVEAHLRHNMYPPPPYSLVPVAVEAVRRASYGGYEEEVYSPIPHRVYGHSVPVFAVIEGLRLEAFDEVYGYGDIR